MTSYLPLTCLLPASQQPWPGADARARPLILSVYGSAAVTAVFVALLGWLPAETRDGSVLGLAERLTTSIQPAGRSSSPSRCTAPGVPGPARLPAGAAA